MAAPVCVLHHHIGDESPFEIELGVSTRLDRFEAQIKKLASEYDIISLDELIDGHKKKKPLLLTFDDAFYSVLDVSREILKPMGLPSVYFINPGLLTPNSISLDSAISWAANKIGIEALCNLLDTAPSASAGSLIADEMSQLTPAEREVRKSIILDKFDPLKEADQRAQLLTPADLPELVKNDVAIGSHTMNHVHCRSLDETSMQQEIVDAKTLLEEYSGAKVRSFSVPYGNETDLTPALLNTLRQSGHEAIFLVHSRSNMIRPAPDIWYRTSLHNEKPEELRKKLVYLPLLRSAKKMMLG